MTNRNFRQKEKQLFFDKIKSRDDWTKRALFNEISVMFADEPYNFHKTLQRIARLYLEGHAETIWMVHLTNDKIKEYIDSMLNNTEQYDQLSMTQKQYIAKFTTLKQKNQRKKIVEKMKYTRSNYIRSFSNKKQNPKPDPWVNVRFEDEPNIPQPMVTI